MVAEKTWPPGQIAWPLLVFVTRGRLYDRLGVKFADELAILGPPEWLIRPVAVVVHISTSLY